MAKLPSSIEYPSIVQQFVAAAPAKRGNKLIKHEMIDMVPADEVGGSLVKSVLNLLDGPKSSIERLAFTQDPAQVNNYSSVYRAKLRLIPDVLLKRLAIQDDLIAAILNARSHHMSAFGRPRPDRFSTGYVIEANVGIVDKMTPEAKKELDGRIAKAVAKFETCGSTEGVDLHDRCSFAQWLAMSTRNAMCLGRLATEFVWVDDVESQQKKFHFFRAIDVGTIFRANSQKQAAQSVRNAAKHLLETIKNEKLQPERFARDEYAWIQVIDSRPVQAFTANECVVHNFYPVPDVELDGYPVTPIDGMLSAVITHINITSHNKLYFQSGRATRGMLVIQSDDVDENVVARVKQQFNASINSVSNAHRMPVFAIGTADKLDWQPIDAVGSGRDMEFQYLTDMNARVIFSAFQISAEELPGWSHLSRGTNSQALSESNNEFRQQAARDTGIRPLIAQFEDFINAHIFPLIDPNLAKISRFRLIGLDAETAEKESVRLQQDMPVHMTFDQVLEKVEKQPIGRQMGGEFPLNPQYQGILDKYFSVGQIKEFFFGIQGAAKDPTLAYFRDPFWSQYQTFLQQAQQMQMQQQQQAAQAQQPQGGDPNSDQQEGAGVSDQGEPKGPQNGNDNGEQPTEDQAANQEAQQQQAQAGQDLTRSIDQAIGLLTKGETKLPPGKRKLLAQHRKVIEQALETWEDDLKLVTKDIVDAVTKKKH